MTQDPRFRFAKEKNPAKRKRKKSNAGQQGDFYVCPQHVGTGGYESCCNCGGWTEDDEDYGRLCTENEEEA